jgi:hypothetical protein
MRFHLGQAPETNGLPTGFAWAPVTMPEVWRWQWMAFPVAIANMGVVAALWLLLTPAASGLRLMSFPVPVFGFVLCLVGVLVVHEFIHSWVHPQAGFSRRSVIGFYPSRMLLYCVYNGELCRDRFLAVLMMPLAIISLVPVIVCVVFQWFSFWLAYVTIVNAFVAAGDVLETITVMKQVPRHATIRGNGWSCYWKPRK